MTDQVPILDFMLVRPPSEVEESAARRKYIRDALLSRQMRAVVDVDLQSPQSPSEIGRLIYRKVFCEEYPGGDFETLQGIRDAVLELLAPRAPQCDGPKRGPSGAGTHHEATHHEGNVYRSKETVDALDIGELERHAYLKVNGLFYLLPDRPEELDAAMAHAFGPLSRVLHGMADKPADAFSAERLAERVRAIFDNQPLSSVVFHRGGYAERYEQSRRVLFDTLYLLYVLRRWASVNFEPVMDALRALHVLEALAVDELYALGLAGKLTDDDLPTVEALGAVYPALKNWNGTKAVRGLPLIATAQDLVEYLGARPVVHPIFAQLHRYARPFNRIKPLGVGDLKVVKQWLVAYEAGEISDIHNVMQGETKERLHRRLEKTEDTFSSSTTTSSESTHDTASTDRFEVKREAENVVKQDLNVNANVRAQYDNKVVLVAVGAGFAYNRSQSDQQKVAQNFSREVVDKAVTRVQTSTVAQRTTTKTFETEETNKHGFDNAPGSGHLSGIYRWVDKRYKAQVFNYGKRMMFEFVLPEPAAFLVESRLRAFESTMDVPRQPKEPEYQTVQMDFEAGEVDEAMFGRLRTRFDLSGVVMPTRTKTVALTDQQTGQAFFTESGMNADRRWWSKTYPCRIAADGYQITKILRAGDTYFANSYDDQHPPAWKERNLWNLSVNGTPLIRADYSHTTYVAFYRPNDDHAPDDGPFVLSGDDVLLTLGFQNVREYALELSLELTVSTARWQSFQIEVYNAVKAIKQRQVDAANAELKNGYDSAMAAFRNRLDDLKATAIHDLIQGQSEAYNQNLIMTELRRQCLAMLTKEFDSVTADDILTDLESMGTRTVEVPYRRFDVDDTEVPLKAEFATSMHEIGFPVPNLEEARNKGRYIQFLEQAFEWGRLGYICYPYFWAISPKWIDLMNRTDDGDPNLTAFLRAGAVKVLVAVTPAYDEAVLHFLATREPWEGGPAPVIGDPLYLPLFEELHRQQDDRYGAVAEGEPWTFTLPTSLVYLHGSTTPLPDVPAIAP